MTAKFVHVPEFLHSVQSVAFLILSDLDELCVCAFANLTECCDGQGIDQPDPVPVQNGQVDISAVGHKPPHSNDSASFTQ